MWWGKNKYKFYSEAMFAKPRQRKPLVQKTLSRLAPGFCFVSLWSQSSTGERVQLVKNLSCK